EAVEESVRLRAGETARKDLTLRGKGTLEGRLYIFDGTPASSVSLWLSPSRASVQRDQEGQYSLSLVAGRYELSALVGGEERTSAFVDVEQDQTVHQDLFIARHSQIAGRVLEVDGTPSAFAWVWSKGGLAEGMGSGVTTAEDGTFSLQGRPPGILRA